MFSIYLYNGYIFYEIDLQSKIIHKHFISDKTISTKLIITKINNVVQTSTGTGVVRGIDVDTYSTTVSNHTITYAFSSDSWTMPYGNSLEGKDFRTPIRISVRYHLCTHIAKGVLVKIVYIIVYFVRTSLISEGRSKKML